MKIMEKSLIEQETGLTHYFYVCLFVCFIRLSDVVIMGWRVSTHHGAVPEHSVNDSDMNDADSGAPPAIFPQIWLPQRVP